MTSRGGEIGQEPVRRARGQRASRPSRYHQARPELALAARFGTFCGKQGLIDGSSPTPIGRADDRSFVLFDRGDEVVVQAGDLGIRFLLVSGKPREEPVAWHGPIVMNTQQELRRAFTDLENGTFLRHRQEK